MENIDYTALTEEPVFFERNRVYRITTGGKLFHDLFGDPQEDTNYPEEWIASSTAASLNNSSDPHEGVSKIKGAEIYFDELLKAEPEKMLGNKKDLGLLVKVLDGSMRLPVQVHPDKKFSQAHLNSSFGKAEAWLILATRGEAGISFGFKDVINEKILIDAIDRNEKDKNALEALMYKIPVKPGDVFLIPAKAVHAIGEGIMLVEIQEPTDFTITPEFWCGDEPISESMKYLGLPRQLALECFDYSINGKEGEKLGRKIPKKYAETDQYTSESLISYDDTPCFALNRHRISGSLRLNTAPGVHIVLSGSGKIITKKGSATVEKPLHKGDYFFLPFALSGLCTVQAGESPLELIECLPPK
jgi:mannose-6-phosphate isomerase